MDNHVRDQTMHFTRSTECRGRNGTFLLDHGSIHIHGEQVCLFLWAKHSTGAPPIALRFTGTLDLALLLDGLQGAYSHILEQRQPL